LSGRSIFLILVLITLICLWIHPCTAATTDIHIVKYANDRTTILSEKTLTYEDMRDTLPVLGDGVTHYYHQGPVFLDDPDPAVEQALRWNPDEDTNCLQKDMGAVKGTDVRELCDLVGGMSAGDTLVVKASDGLTKEFAYSNVYSPSSRQGPMVITWYCSGIATCAGPYPDSGYSDGMRLIFFADTSVNPWGEHVFGNYDWHESADPADWYYYYDGLKKYPTTTGLSIKSVSEIQIYSTKSPASSATVSGGGTGIWNGEGALPAPGSAPPDNTALYGYTGKRMSTINSGTLNGSIRLFFDPGAEPAVVNNRIREFNLTLDLPPQSNLTLARMYVYISHSHNLQTNKGTVPRFFALFDTQHLEADNLYIDTDGDEARFVAATYAYNVLPLLKGNGTYKLSVQNMESEQAVFTIDGVLLITSYENETAPAASYWIAEGCDVVLSIPEKKLFPDDCKTDYSFAGKVNMSNVRQANLYLVSTGQDHDNSTEHSVKFNKGIWQNIFNNPAPLVVQLPVTKFLNETGNTVTIESSIRSRDADYLINRNAILVIQDQDPDQPADDRNASITGRVQKAPPDDTSDIIPAMNESSRCQISLDTDPEGALVYVDGLYLGKTTPYTLDVDKGQIRNIRFELDGYQSAETTIIPNNSSCIRTSLYAPVHSSKGRLSEIPEDPDGIRYGGLYIHSRPRDAMIFIDGIDTEKKTPAVIMGLEPGRHAVRVVREIRDISNKERYDITFEEKSAFVSPGVLVPVDINGIGYTRLDEIIVDSRYFRGLPFTLNGYPLNSTVPMTVRTAQFDSFITIHENESYISFPIPVTVNEDHYWQFNPRAYQSLTLSVNSDPRGALVYLDGFDTGFTTPYTFGNISDGPHRIMVTKNGYLPKESLINLPFRSVPIPTTSVDFVLDEYPSGFLSVSSVPAGGKISIDGVFSGEITPALFKSISTGSHSVKVTGTNTSKTVSDIVITSLEMTNITMDLTDTD
jgi:hypothetical protein